MATESAISHSLHPDEHPERHEHSDLQIRHLVIALIAGIIVVGATLVMVYWLFWFFQAVQTHYDVPQTAIKTPKIQVREPRVQGIPGYHTNLPWQDLADMMKQVNDQLKSYGPTQASGYVHIPIKKAMKLALKDGTLKSMPGLRAPETGGADAPP